MTDGPANENDEYVTGTLDCSIEEFMLALEGSGAVVERGLLTEEGEFLVQAND